MMHFGNGDKLNAAKHQSCQMTNQLVNNKPLTCGLQDCEENSAEKLTKPETK